MTMSRSDRRLPGFLTRRPFLGATRDRTTGNAVLALALVPRRAPAPSAPPPRRPRGREA